MSVDWDRVNEVVSRVIDNESIGINQSNEQALQSADETRNIVDEIVEAFNRSGY